MKLKIILSLIATFTLSTSLFAQSENVNFTNGAKFIEKKISKNNKEKFYEIDATYPEIVGLNSPNASKFNAFVKSKVLDVVQRFEKDLEKMTEEDLKLFKERKVNNYAEIGYVIELANNDVVSLYFGNNYYTGGAHPNLDIFTINYNLKEGKEITLKELFRPANPYLEVISDEAIEQLEKKLKSPKDEWIRRGASPKASNFENWNITKEGLTITFENYQVTAYVYGPQQILLSYKEFRKLLSYVEFEPMKTAIIGEIDPTLWCVADNIDDFNLATIKGAKNARTYFYGVEGEEDSNFSNTVINSKKYRKKSYLISGDNVLILKTIGKWACGWYQNKKGKGTVGWLQTNKLSFSKENPAQSIEKWLGEWNHSDIAAFEIKRSEKSGKLKFEGYADWVNSYGAPHIGIIEDVHEKPVKNRITLNQDECQIRMRLLGKYLLIEDNLKCGGLNVTFNGVYWKK